MKNLSLKAIYFTMITAVAGLVYSFQGNNDEYSILLDSDKLYADSAAGPVANVTIGIGPGASGTGGDGCGGCGSGGGCGGE